MDIGNDGISARDTLVNIGNDGMGVHHVTTNIGNDYVCVYCKFGLGADD